eukprot:PhF_6_TR6949/c0_g1_i3/m.10209/K14157/AASS; alpha-aminoadipic semialdehyde synthase
MFLVAGSGMCSGPCVSYLISNHYNVVWVDSNETSIQSSIKTYNLNTSCLTPLVADLTTPAGRHAVVQLCVQRGCKVAISLLPPPLHPCVVKIALEVGIHVVTASYISPELRALQDAAVTKGIMIMNEMGLDPGIDIMSSVLLLRKVVEQDGRCLVSYSSACGALPHPLDAASTNAMEYKFSWSPRGVLTAMTRPAVLKENGVWRTLQGGTTIYDNTQVVPMMTVFGKGPLIAIPNGDAKEYAENVFRLDTTSLQGFNRCSLRYSKYPAAVSAFIALGLLDDKHTVPELMSQPTSGITWDDLIRLLRRRNISTKDPSDLSPEQIKILTKLDLLNTQVCVPVTHSGKCLDSLCAHLQPRLSYNVGERDVVVMLHRILARDTNNVNHGTTYLYTSELVVEGESHVKTATALTVGLPLAIAAEGIVLGRISVQPGLARPIDVATASYVMNRLSHFGVHMKEKVIEVSS